MAQSAWHCIAFLLMLTLLGCGDSKEETLIGRWNCNGNARGLTYSGETEYVANGRSTSTFEIRGNDSGNSFQFTGVSNGTWSVKGDQLLESVEKFTVVTFQVNGQQVPASSFPAQLAEALEGASAGSTIEKLSNNILIARSGADHVSCSR